MTKLALRHVFNRLPAADARKILGENGITRLRPGQRLPPVGRREDRRIDAGPAGHPPDLPA